MNKKIQDIITASSLYRIITYLDEGYDHISINFYIDCTTDTIQIYKLDDDQGEAWRMTKRASIKDCLRFLAIMTTDLNGYFDATLTADGMTRIYDKAERLMSAPAATYIYGR